MGDLCTDESLGHDRVELLFWKSLTHLQGTTDGMAALRDALVLAARELWPNPAVPGESLYEASVRDALLSRGFPLPGQASVSPSLPPSVRPDSRGNGVGFTLPGQPLQSAALPDAVVGQWWSDKFLASPSSPTYVAYTFWKHSKLGPGDYLDIRGLSNYGGVTVPCLLDPRPGDYPVSGMTYPSCGSGADVRLKDREVGNVTVLLPGPALLYFYLRGILPLNSSWEELVDWRAFGFRCIKATPNGFSFKAARTGQDLLDPAGLEDRRPYRLSIVDPSLGLPAPLGNNATYQWSFVEYDGAAVTMSGQTVDYAALIDRPFTLTITRTRTPQGQAAIIDTLTLRERGNDLGRAGIQGPGASLVFDGVSPSTSRDFPLSNQAAACGATVRFVTAALGLAPRTILWKHNGATLVNGVQPGGTTVSGADTETLTLSGVTTGSAGVYQCLVSNALGVSPGDDAAATLTVTSCCPADVGQQGGVAGRDGLLDSNDFIVFIDLFFAADPLADRGTQGGVAGQDGYFDNNDFVVFIDLFFQGC